MKRKKKSCIGLSNCSFEQFKGNHLAICLTPSLFGIHLFLTLTAIHHCYPYPLTLLEGIDFLKQTDAILDDDIFAILKRVCSYLFFCVKNDNFEFVKSYENAERAGKAKGSQRAQVGQAAQGISAVEAATDATAASAAAPARVTPWRNAPHGKSETTMNYEFEDEDFIIVKNINRLLLNKLIEDYVGYPWLCLTLTEYLNDLDYLMNKQGRSKKEEEKEAAKEPAMEAAGEEAKEEEKKEINARKKVYKLVKKITQVKKTHQLHTSRGGQPNGGGKKAIHKLEAKNKYINYLFCYYNNFFLSSNGGNGENAQGEDVIVLDPVDNAYRWIYTDEEHPSGVCAEEGEKHPKREKHLDREKRVRMSSGVSPPTKRNAHLKRRRKCYGVRGVDGQEGVEGKQEVPSHTERHGPFHEQVQISPGKDHPVHCEQMCDPSEGDKGRAAKRGRRCEEKRQKRRLERRLQRRLERRQQRCQQRPSQRRGAPREESPLRHLYKALCDFLSTKYETSKLLKFMDEYRDMYAWKPPPFYWKILSSKYVVKEILKLYEDRYLDPFLSCLYEDYVNKYYFDDEESSNIATYTSNFNVFTLRVSEEIQKFLLLEEPEEEEAVFRICKNICVSENSYIYAQMILEYMYRNNNDSSMRRLSQFLSLYILYKDINLHKICNNYFAKVVENEVSITFLTFRINNLNSYSTLYSTFRNIYMARNKGCMEINHSDIVSLYDAIVNVLKIFNGNKLLLFDSTYLFASYRGRNRLRGEATRERDNLNEGNTNLKRQLISSADGEDQSFHFHHRVEDADFNSNFSNINRSNLEEVCRRGDVPTTKADDAFSVRSSLPGSPSEKEESLFSKGEEVDNPSEDSLPALRGADPIGENQNSLFGSSLNIGGKERMDGDEGEITEMNDNKTDVSNRSSKNLSNEIYSSIKSEDFVSNVNSENNQVEMKTGKTKSTASEFLLPPASQYGNEDFNYNKEFLRINIYAEKIPLIHMRDIVFLNNAINIYVSNNELFSNNMYRLYGKVLIFLTTYSPYEYVYNHYYASFFRRCGEGSSRKYSAAYFSVYDDTLWESDGVSGESDDEEAGQPHEQRKQEQQEKQQQLPHLPHLPRLPHQRDDRRRALEANAPSEPNLAPGLSAAGKPTGKRTYQQFCQVKKEPERRKSILKRGRSYAGGDSEVQAWKRRQEVDNAELAKRKKGEVPPLVLQTGQMGQSVFETEKTHQSSFETEQCSKVTKENCNPADVDSPVEASKEGAPVEQENVTVSAAVEKPTEEHRKRPPPNEAVQKGGDANAASSADPVQEDPASETFPSQTRDTHNSNASNTADDMLELRTEVMSCDEIRSSIFKNVKSKKKLKINPTSKKKKYYFYRLFQKFRLTYNTFLKYTQNEIYQIYQIIHGNYSDATKDKLLLARVNSNLAASLIYRYVYINVYEHVNHSRVNLLYPKFILLKYIVDKYPQKRHLALHFLKELYTYIIEKEESLEEFVELRENLVLFFVYFLRFENMFCYVVGVIKSMVHLLDKALIRLFIIKTLAFCAPPYDFKFCECLLNFIHFVLKKEGVYYKNEFKRAILKFLDNIAEMHRMYQSSKTKEVWDSATPGVFGSAKDFNQGRYLLG
ncbi:hypothetical protein C922_04542 [Plasmodium inui San Antonio 1]|uniref:Uncharacterized protein n=1 Tax=Plasmodium inui San Antonio 1 TaxID=1237626 RepID=W7AIC2_9APIC|nr:hypothetical protein C922_04542 [Plasmodium inui San Antonio 1]EUD65031.1 hypothetical protein C922_04542 [Plasmodium inui San Antonio 1]